MCFDIIIKLLSRWCCRTQELINFNLFLLRLFLSFGWIKQHVSCSLVNRLWCLIAAVQAFGDAIGEMVIAGVRVAHRVVVGRHACQVNHPDLCLHDNQCVAQAFSCLWSPYSWIMEVPGHQTYSRKTYSCLQETSPNENWCPQDPRCPVRSHLCLHLICDDYIGKRITRSTTLKSLAFKFKASRIPYL